MKKTLTIVILLITFIAGYCLGATLMVNKMEQLLIEKETPIEYDISVELAKEITVLRPSYMTSTELDNFSSKSRLYGIGEYLLEAEEETGIGADILLAIICHETGKGTNPWSQPPYNNLFSWGVYGGTCHIPFDSYQQCILGGYRNYKWVTGVPSRIKQLYLTKGGAYYKGETLYSIGTHYAQDTSWYKGVERWLDLIPKSEISKAKSWAVGSKVFKPFDKSKGILEPWDYWAKGLDKEDFAIILYRLNGR